MKLQMRFLLKPMMLWQRILCCFLCRLLWTFGKWADQPSFDSAPRNTGCQATWWQSRWCCWEALSPRTQTGTVLQEETGLFPAPWNPPHQIPHFLNRRIRPVPCLSRLILWFKLMLLCYLKCLIIFAYGNMTGCCSERFSNRDSQVLRELLGLFHGRDLWYTDPGTEREWGERVQYGEIKYSS